MNDGVASDHLGFSVASTVASSSPARPPTRRADTSLRGRCTCSKCPPVAGPPWSATRPPS
jgi:hypothetical protein